jgi:hypothetical protein
MATDEGREELRDGTFDLDKSATRIMEVGVAPAGWNHNALPCPYLFSCAHAAVVAQRHTAGALPVLEPIRPQSKSAPIPAYLSTTLPDRRRGSRP